MKKMNLVTLSMMAGVLVASVGTVASAEEVKEVEVIDGVTIDSTDGFSDEEKTVIDAKIKNINDTRQSLIQKGIVTGDWSEYNAFEATQQPAYYTQLENGEFVENKFYYVNSLERYLKYSELSQTIEDKTIWDRELRDTLEKFRNAPAPEGIVPYVIGINQTEELAKFYQVEEPSESFWNSKYNSGSVSTNGKFEEKAKDVTPALEENAIENVQKVVTGDTVEVEGKTIDAGVVDAVFEVVTEAVDTEEELEVINGVTIDPTDGFSDEEKTVIDAKIKNINDTRQSLIQKGIATGDWSEHNAFEATQQPAYYTQLENGEFVENKFYYVNSLERYVKYSELAETAEDKTIWDRELRDTLEKFRNAPAPEGIVPYVIGINQTEELAKFYQVEEPSESFWNSKYNSGSVATYGKFDQ